MQAQFGGADVIVDGIGDAARDENFKALARRGHWISLGQASGALQPIAADQLVQKSITFSRPAVFDYVATNAHSGRARAARLGGARRRHAEGAADRTPFARRRRRGARAARVAPDDRRAGPDRLRIAPAFQPEEAAMIVGMNHFTVIAEDATATLDFYVGLLGCASARGPTSASTAPGCTATRRRRCCTSTSTASRRPSAPA